MKNFFKNIGDGFKMSYENYKANMEFEKQLDHRAKELERQQAENSKAILEIAEVIRDINVLLLEMEEDLSKDIEDTDRGGRS